MDTHRIHTALYRASQPSLSSFALAGRLLSIIHRCVTICGGYLEDAAASLSIFALVYVGLTGEGFWVNASDEDILVVYP
ncbi:hypothetical protein BGW80DRAFT_1267305 [Lactifluus volemus]|nr:hypothetical protein BGW80DRAFT_1267305 [Lactifluus volemus]